MAQYANVNFDTYIKEADLIKTVPIKNPVPENINPVKILDDFVKISLKIKRSRRILISTTFLKIFKVEKEHSVKVELKEIQEFVEQTVLLLPQAK